MDNININNEGAELLLKTFRDGGHVCGQGKKDDGKIISIENGTCIVKFENGNIKKYRHPLFYKNNKK